MVQSPSFYGQLIDLAPIAEKAHAHGALLVAVFTEVVSLGLIEPPGAQGADIVAGEGQSIGNALNFGGPYVGLFATRAEISCGRCPGRLSGKTVDAEGKRGFVLTLSTREQHIRREKATSNICTNSGLCSLAFTAHMTLLGETGLRQLAEANHARACQLADALAKVKGVEVLNEAFFNEFTVRAAEAGGGRRRGAGGEGHHGRRAGLAAGAGTTRSREPARRRGDGDGDRRGYRGVREGAGGGAVRRTTRATRSSPPCGEGAAQRGEGLQLDAIPATPIAHPSPRHTLSPQGGEG